MNNRSPSRWDDMVLLYIYKKGLSWWQDITRNVTKHPERTRRVLDRLEALGFIKSEYKMVQLLPNTYPFKQRIIVLTEKGKEYVEKYLLNDNK